MFVLSTQPKYTASKCLDPDTMLLVYPDSCIWEYDIQASWSLFTILVYDFFLF